MRGQQAAHVHQALRLLRSASCFAVSGLRVRPDRGGSNPTCRRLSKPRTRGSPSRIGSPARSRGSGPRSPRRALSARSTRPPKACCPTDPALFRPPTPKGCLRNPPNVCYLNATSQAFAWVGQLTVDEDSCYGAARAAMKPVLEAGRPYLPECLAWRAHLRDWDRLTQQQDACQFHDASPCKCTT